MQLPCTVLIDEPENHLHPSMQREFLPRLMEAFPSHKFIVATHSPFVVSSTPDAAVYALLYDENRRVTSKLLDESDLAASPNKVLREVLDVPVTMPVWVDRANPRRFWQDFRAAGLMPALLRDFEQSYVLRAWRRPSATFLLNRTFRLNSNEASGKTRRSQRFLPLRRRIGSPNTWRIRHRTRGDTDTGRRRSRRRSVKRLARNASTAKARSATTRRVTSSTRFRQAKTQLFISTGET